MIFVTVDMLVSSSDTDGKMHFLFVQRKNEPFKGMWALPGGFLNEGEDPLQGALRELREETGLIVDPTDPAGDLFQIGAFGDPKRDPRGHVISIAYRAYTPEHCPPVHGADDATIAQWIFAGDVLGMPLSFDHAKIIEWSHRRIEDSFDGPHLLQ